MNMLYDSFCSVFFLILNFLKINIEILIITIFSSETNSDYQYESSIDKDKLSKLRISRNVKIALKY